MTIEFMLLVCLTLADSRHRLLPLIAIITPSTLTTRISNNMELEFHDLMVPQINWTYSNFISYAGAGFYQGPSADTTRIGKAVSALGSMLTMQPFVNNSTYQLQFYAPAVQCLNANETVYEMLRPLKREGSLNAPFVAFVPRTGGLISSYNASLNLNSNSSEVLPGLDEVSTDTAKLFIATAWTPTLDRSSSLKVSECSFYNYSYTMGFSFVNGIQYLTSKDFTKVNPLPSHDHGVIPTDPDVATRLSYQSMIETLGNLLVGSLYISASGEENYLQTSLAFTPLIGAEEFGVISPPLSGTPTNKTGARNFTLASGVEELFQNITLSLFASPPYLYVTCL